MSLSVLALLALGALASKVRFGPLYLGTLGALLVGVIGGYLGVLVPQILIDAGILILIFVIGVQAGPRFLRTFRRDGSRILFVSCSAIICAALSGILLRPIFPMSFEMFLGTMAGGFSSAAAFAALIDSLESVKTTEIILGYSASYPLSTILVLLFVPLVIRLQKNQLSHDDTKWAAEEPQNLEKGAFKITNTKLMGKTISQIEPIRALSVNLSRVISKEDEKTFTPDYVFNIDDIIIAVGKPSALSGLGMILGEELSDYKDQKQHIFPTETYVTSFSVAGKTIKELNIRSKYGVMITRVRREGVEFLPRADFTLEFGDTIIVVGEPAALDKLTKDFNPDKARLNESQIIPMLLGIAVGVMVGQVPVTVYGSSPIRLGASGGVFIVSMLLGYIRGLGRIRLYLPIPASNVLRDLGLLCFIVGTGALAGNDIDALLTVSGLYSCLLGGIVSIVLLVSTHMLSKLVKFDSFESIGSVCGNLNASSALPQAGSRYLREVSSVLYASFYPVALIIKIIIVQALLILR